jgi:isopentenyl-diphosphate delta-isomerase
MAGSDSPDISRRKAEHLDLAASHDSAFAETATLLDEVQLVHDALPELALADISLETELCGKILSAPLVISGMTGGTAEAATLNHDLARAAESCGIAIGLGSQRAMAEHPDLAASFRVRAAAPTALVIGNLGVVQARQMGPAAVAELARSIEADAMAIHLNPAQELIQENGDRDFRGCLDAIARIVDAVALPVLVKETGCGISPRVARRLQQIGVHTVDVSGAGGTSWVAVEALRAARGSDSAALGQELREWGLPTAVSLAACVQTGMTTIASGGIRNGLDVARAIALGARAAGMAAPLLRAHRAGGHDAVVEALARIIHSIQALHLLTGSRTCADLRRAPRHLGPTLRAWLDDLRVDQPPP